MIKYTQNFERDFNWYLKMRHIFNFDGASKYIDKKGQEIVLYDKTGISGKEAFYHYDSSGKIVPTKHPLMLYSLLKTKGSTNLHVKMFAYDRAEGMFPLHELKEFCDSYKSPDWFIKAVELQKIKILLKDTTKPDWFRSCVSDQRDNIDNYLEKTALL